MRSSLALPPKESRPKIVHMGDVRSAPQWYVGVVWCGVRSLHQSCQVDQRRDGRHENILRPGVATYTDRLVCARPLLKSTIIGE